MKTYICYVYERNRKFWDRYIVVAEGELLAKAELKRRLDEETDAGSDSYDIMSVVAYK